jgi:hypothetical protein
MAAEIAKDLKAIEKLVESIANDVRDGKKIQEQLGQVQVGQRASRPAGRPTLCTSDRDCDIHHRKDDSGSRQVGGRGRREGTSPFTSSQLSCPPRPTAPTSPLCDRFWEGQQVQPSSAEPKKGPEVQPASGSSAGTSGPVATSADVDKLIQRLRYFARSGVAF